MKDNEKILEVEQNLVFVLDVLRPMCRYINYHSGYFPDNPEMEFIERFGLFIYEHFIGSLNSEDQFRAEIITEVSIDGLDIFEILSKPCGISPPEKKFNPYNNLVNNQAYFFRYRKFNTHDFNFNLVMENFYSLSRDYLSDRYKVFNDVRTVMAGYAYHYSVLRRDPLPLVGLPSHCASQVLLRDPMQIVMSYLSYPDKIALKVASRGLFQILSPLGTRLSMLAKYVTLGDLVKVEQMLSLTPQLALMKANFTDLSNREFSHATAFQYAVWALDRSMWEIILKYLPNEAAGQQLKDLDDPTGDIVRAHGAEFSFADIIEKIRFFIDNYNAWPGAALNSFWHEFVASAQKMLPASVIFSWLRSDSFLNCYNQERNTHELLSWFKNQSPGKAVDPGYTYCCSTESQEMGRRVKLDYVQRSLDRLILHAKERPREVSNLKKLFIKSTPVYMLNNFADITGQREDIIFINQIFHRMNELKSVAGRENVNPSTATFIAEFGCFIYQHLGIASPRARELVQASRLILFASSNDKNVDSSLLLACPALEIQVDTCLIRRKFYSLLSKMPREVHAHCKKIERTIQGHGLLSRLPPPDHGLLSATITNSVISSLDRKSTLSLRACSRYLFSAITPSLENVRLKRLLHYVMESDLTKIEVMLNLTPDLAKQRGNITDLSNRQFSNISAFQYALWALDKPMWELILRYLPAEEARTQLEELENQDGAIARSFGTHFSFDDLVDKLSYYVKSYNKSKFMENRKYCAEILGEAQKKLPAWVICMWSEKGDYVAWNRCDPYEVVWQRNIDLHYWFKKITGKELYGYGRVAQRSGDTAAMTDEIRLQEKDISTGETADIRVLKTLAAARQLDLDELRRFLCSASEDGILTNDDDHNPSLIEEPVLKKAGLQ
jgi:hypothetical protein